MIFTGAGLPAIRTMMRRGTLLNNFFPPTEEALIYEGGLGRMDATIDAARRMLKYRL